MNWSFRRLGVGLVFALFGFASLVVADKVSQLLCAHLSGCGHVSSPCPIDACEGDVRLNTLRLAVWVGPAVVFGASAFLFGGRHRPLAAWIVLLVALVLAHTLIMTAVR